MTDYLANKESLLYKDRFDFKFLLDSKSEHWFSSGSWGLYNLSELLIACYTAERKLNCLNDLTCIINSHKETIMKIHGKTLKDMKEWLHKDFGAYFCIATIYNLEGEMQNELKDSIERFLNIINLEEYFNSWVFKYTNSDDLSEHMPSIRGECCHREYRELEYYIEDAENEQDLSIKNMYKVVREYDLPI